MLDINFNEIFKVWTAYTLKAPDFRPHQTVEGMTYFPLSDEDKAAYDAPFPSREYMALPRVWPSMMLQVPGVNFEAWEGLQRFDKPFLVVYGLNDPGILGSEETYKPYFENVPGTSGQPHTTLKEASHFLQDDQGEEIARRIVNFMEANPLP